VRFGSEGKLAAIGYGTSVGVWSLEHEEELFLGYHKGIVEALYFSPDEKKVVSGSRDRSVRI